MMRTSSWKLNVGQLMIFAEEQDGLWRYFRAVSRGWRIASFFAALSLSMVVFFSESISLSANVLL